MRRCNRCWKLVLKLSYCLVALSIVQLGFHPQASCQEPFEDELIGNDVLVRTGAGREHSAIGRLYKGMKVKVLKAEGEWCQIELPLQRFSWVKKDLLDTTGTGTAQVKTSGVYIRGGPGTDFSELGQVQAGFKVNVLRELEGWCLVTPSEPTGWLSARYLKEAGKELPPAPPTVSEKLTPTQAQAQFERGEKLFAEIISKPVKQWNFDEVKQICEDVIDKSDDPSLRFAAKSRLADITRAERLVKIQENLAKRLEGIDKSYQAEVAKIRARKAAAFYIAKGTIEKLVIDYLPPATHKLMVEGSLTHLLYSEKLKLDDYLGNYLGLKGALEKARAGDVAIIKVEAVDPIEMTEE